MGVSSTVNRVSLFGNGISTSFPFPYYFVRGFDLFVYVYDTLLGGVTGPLVLNVDYSIVGTPNYQGLYTNGANVNFLLYTPLITDIVVIVRSPIQTQNYSLLQGGTISSPAIVQQMDYLTLLIQRLQDEISRCIQVPDGVGPAFSGQLPSNVELLVGQVPAVNLAGNGWTMITPAAGGGGGGGVTAVGLVLPASVFSVAGSPVTTLGNLTGSFINQTRNLVFAGPPLGAPGVPTFRALVPADLPAMGPVNVINGGDANYNFGASDAYVRSGTALTANRLWTLAAAITVGQEVQIKNLKSQTFNIVLAGNGGDLIDGFGNITLNPGNSVDLVCGAVGQWDVV